MPTVQPSAHDLANRRMVVGVLLSLLAHALILSIGFGLSGTRAGGAGPITVSLAPLPPPVAVPEALPAPSDAAPAAPPVSAPVPAPARASGFRLFDPVPMAPPPAPPQPQGKPARRRRPVRFKKPPARERSSMPVIVQQDNPDAAFRVPLADIQAEPVPQAPQPGQVAPEPGPEVHGAEEAAERARAERQHEVEEEARRMARLREEAERQRLAEDERAQAAERAQEERLAEERAAAAQRQVQAQAEQEREQARRRDEAAARERLLASERELEAQREARRLQEEQVRQERDRQERVARELARAQELAAQRALAEEQAREAAMREAARLAAEELARRLAAERERAARQSAEETARQHEAEAARQRAQQLARQQEEDERAGRQGAQQAAAQAERARQAAQGTRAAGMPAGPPGNGAAPGGGGSLPRSTLDGAGLASRARELLRGIELPATPPAALRPAQQMAHGRRRAVDTLERDVPLRLYVDSFRQKIERNAAQIRMQVASGPGRADPLVSVALRSDGSVDDVTIVRSSGRADLDEAVRRIVHLNARYAAFPPHVAARFDVIEIRRIWVFAENLKLLEEVR